MLSKEKRVRKQTQRYDVEVFSSQEYQKLLFCDIPKDEIKAAIYDEDFTEEEFSDEEDEDDDVGSELDE